MEVVVSRGLNTRESEPFRPVSASLARQTGEGLAVTALPDEPKTQKRHIAYQSVLFQVLIWLTLAFTAYQYSSQIGVGWNEPIGIGPHNDRQAQTVLSAYYMTQGSDWILYETPLLGPPWTIPMEFPVYQWAVAAATLSTGYPLDQSARLVGVVAFLASLVFFWKILGLWKLTQSERALPLALMLSAPLYRFWPWSGMIESTALLLCLVYVYFGIKAVRRPSWIALFFAAAIGAAAMATKATTFVAFNLGMALLIAVHWWTADSHKIGAVQLKRYALLALFLAVIPIVATQLWVIAADEAKAASPLSEFIMSSNLSTRHFGTFDDRFSLDKWQTILGKTLTGSIGSVLVFLCAMVVSFFAPRFLAASVCLTLLGIATPFIFPKLHFVHLYYPYANGIFFITAFGLILIGLFREKRVWSVLMAVGLLITSIYQTQENYRESYGRPQHHRSLALKELSQVFAARENKDEVLLIWGDEWSGSIPYATKRRALMERGNRDLDDPDLVEALGKLERPIGGLVFCARRGGAPAASFVDERLAHFEFSSDYREIRRCRFYLDHRSPS